MLDSVAAACLRKAAPISRLEAAVRGLMFMYATLIAGVAMIALGYQ
jgi:hypothetical protein